ncbi:MAG: ribosomal protein S18-alanine N-acetyltransferase, partial [Ruminococcus sp.]|nr:ribosomal protein S18-alanine N-acetyltransferase [Ruminococcus sp.]
MMQKVDLHKVASDADSAVFSALSALDKKCIGAEGWSAESFQSEVEKDNGTVICCYDDMRIIGLICGYFAGDEADITSVAVDESYRRHGIAVQLMQEFENHLPEYISEIFLEVRESNVPAISLYNKCGFEKLSVRKNFYENPTENAVVMVKKLTENYKNYSDISFPDKTILEVSFLSVSDFYSIYFNNNNYTIVGGDKGIDNLIGIAEDEKVYYISVDDNYICYIAVNIETFIKEILLFDNYMNTEADKLPKNPDDAELSEFTNNFKSKIIELDADAFHSSGTFWAEICEEMEYGI